MTQLCVWAMRMAVDDCREAGGCWIEIECGDVVQNVQLQLADFDDVSQRERLCPFPGVHISTNGKRRGDGSKLFEDLRAPDIAGMDDQV